jgi:hypothetical protein
VALTAPGIFLATTADHPFWNASAKKWQRADTLAASGGRLLTFRGREIPVRAGALKPIRTGRAFNFTVAHLHTYYVMAGNTPVLVHNCGGKVPWITGTLPAAEESALSNTLTHIDSGTVPAGPTDKRWGTQFKN